MISLITSSTTDPCSLKSLTWYLYVCTFLWKTSCNSIYRKNQLAETHCKQNLLRKYFTAWQLWVNQEVERKELESAQSSTKSKMAALLDAAATGKLWHGNETDRTSSTIDTATSRSNRTQSARTGRNTVKPSASEIVSSPHLKK